MNEQNQNTGCKTCGGGDLTTQQGWMLGLAIYILIAAVYGTIKISENIFNAIFN